MSAKLLSGCKKKRTWNQPYLFRDFLAKVLLQMQYIIKLFFTSPPWFAWIPSRFSSCDDRKGELGAMIAAWKSADHGLKQRLELDTHKTGTKRRGEGVPHFSTTVRQCALIECTWESDTIQKWPASRVAMSEPSCFRSCFLSLHCDWSYRNRSKTAFLYHWY